jgi:DNA-binding transcriptional regulator YdaS (Cro superfamily)
MDQPKLPVERAIEALGGTMKAAEILGIPPNRISMWKNRKQVPVGKVLAVEAATNISRHELRPDIFGAAA